MLQAFPFLKNEDVDECWYEMKESKPIFKNDLDNRKIDQFILYFEKTWVSENGQFDRSICLECILTNIPRGKTILAKRTAIKLMVGLGNERKFRKFYGDFVTKKRLS